MFTCVFPPADLLSTHAAAVRRLIKRITGGVDRLTPADVLKAAQAGRFDLNSPAAAVERLTGK